MEVYEWKERLEQEREEKDRFFAAHSQSPISLEERARFEGLSYYPPDSNFRFELELREHSDKKTIQIEDTKGKMRQFLRWGEFRFNVGNEECTLQAYKSDPEEERLFVPFRDATSGKETYGAGRYLDLDLKDRTPDGGWILDFNNAYNPWCAYSEDYACPFVPPENWLKVSMEAGEKNYHLKKEYSKEQIIVEGRIVMNKSKVQPRVIVFTSSTCSWCQAVKRYLQEKRIRFREVDVSRDANAARDLARRGHQGVPVVFINNRPVVGFNKPEIDRLLGIR